MPWTRYLKFSLTSLSQEFGSISQGSGFEFVEGLASSLSLLSEFVENNDGTASRKRSKRVFR